MSSASVIGTRKAIENLKKIDLIGNVSHQITGAKLPSNRQVLQVLFYNMRFVKMTAMLGAKLAISAVEIFWQQARIPIREEHKCVEKLVKLYDKWKIIQKTVPGKRSSSQKEAAESFLNSLDDLFDIATADALEKIRIAEDREFLEMQRKKGRPGCMAGVDKVLWDRENRAQVRKDKEAARKRKHEEEMSRTGKGDELQYCNVLFFIFYRCFSINGV